VRRWEGRKVTEVRGGWGKVKSGDFFMGNLCGDHKTPPSAYIMGKISSAPNANIKGRREYDPETLDLRVLKYRSSCIIFDQCSPSRAEVVILNTYTKGVFRLCTYIID